MDEYSKDTDVLTNGTYWWRCRFELVKDSGVWVIRPDHNFQIQFYQPLKEGEKPKQPKKPDDEEQNWGPHIHLARIKKEEEVIAFVNRWGLLGLWNTGRFASPIFLPDRGSVQEMFGEQYSEWYLWNLPPGINPQYPNLIMHQEPLHTFMEAAEEYQTWLDNLSSSEGNNENAVYSLSGCTPGIVYDASAGKWDLCWSFGSLYKIIYLRTALEQAEAYKFIRCAWPHCKKLFAAKLPKDRFCSSRCQNNYYVTQNRNNN